MSAPNVELLRLTLAHIEANPDAWDQKDWHSCFAGHAAILSGASWASDEPDDYDVLDEEGNLCFVRELAFKRLGLINDDECYDYGIFAGSNTLDDLRRLVDEICAECTPA